MKFKQDLSDKEKAMTHLGLEPGTSMSVVESVDDLLLVRELVLASFLDASRDSWSSQFDWVPFGPVNSLIADRPLKGLGRA